MSAENPLTNKQVIQAFSDGVIHTLVTMAKTKPTAEKPFIEKKFKPKGAVAGMIGMVSGKIKGNLTISFEKEAALKIINNMVGESHTEIDGQVLDAIGELTNIIYGCAKTVLNEFGYAFQMAIPIVIEGYDGIIPMHKGTNLVLPFSTDSHKFNLEIIVQ